MATPDSDDATRCAQAIFDCVGPDIRLAVPIGIGKPVLLLDALYRMVAADRSLKLTIFTGLTLSRPRFRNDLERRFAGPLLDRLFPTYPEPLYVAALIEDRLPANITVNEFFLQAGAWLGNGPVQRNYISLDYSHVAQHLERAGTNVFAQLVAPGSVADASHVSLSSNTDVTLDVLPYIASRRKSGQSVIIAGEINSNLPYMPGQAEMRRADFDILLEPKTPAYELFAPPKEPVSLVDYAMALHAAALVEDGGTLQIGIGSFADAFVQALILRHTNNSAFRDLLGKLGTVLPPDASLDPFTAGLYGCTEMLVDGFLTLMDAGILKRTVDAPDGSKTVLHAGFFVGNRAFYQRLKAMPPAQLAQIAMTAISYTNTLRGDSERKHAERRHARFVNTAMTATLLGAVSSDALDDGRVVSGVGGQHDLVGMAHELDGGRSILAVRSIRRQGGKDLSNITWTYANATIPRALRDIVVTEYGIADIRGKSDRDTIAAMLAVTDSAFQNALQSRAQHSGKLEQFFSLPPRAAQNHKARLEAALGPARRAGLLPEFPLGSDMTPVEQSLVGPLTALKTAGLGERLRALMSGLRGPSGTTETAALERLGLSSPSNLSQRAQRCLVLGAMRSPT